MSLLVSKVSENIKKGVYEQTVKVSPNTVRQQKLIDLRSIVLLDPKAPPASGMMDDVEQAVRFFQTRNGTLPEDALPVRDLPEIFYLSSAGTDFTPIDAALSELAKRGIVGLKKPAVEQKVDKLSFSYRRLLEKVIPLDAQCVCWKRLALLMN